MNSSLRKRVLTLIAVFPLALLMIASVVVAQTTDSDTTDVGLFVTAPAITQTPAVTSTPGDVPTVVPTATPSPTEAPATQPTPTGEAKINPTAVAVTGLPSTGGGVASENMTTSAVVALLAVALVAGAAYALAERRI